MSLFKYDRIADVTNDDRCTIHGPEPSARVIQKPYCGSADMNPQEPPTNGCSFIMPIQRLSEMEVNELSKPVATYIGSF